jgi:DNA-binding NarL/FixJ family response regulator
LIRVVLADDHNLVRAGLRALLEDVPDVEVVGDYADGREALAAVVEKRPDVALLDIGMPGLSGLDAAARIADEAPGTRVVIVSMHGNERFVAQALAAGVAGYVMKDACADELPVLLRAVVRGETYLSPAISKRIVEAMRATRGGDEAEGPLTPRQREILQLLARGQEHEGDRAHARRQREDGGDPPGADHGAARHPRRARPRPLRGPHGPRRLRRLTRTRDLTGPVSGISRCRGTTWCRTFGAWNRSTW